MSFWNRLKPPKFIRKAVGSLPFIPAPIPIANPWGIHNATKGQTAPADNTGWAAAHPGTQSVFDALNGDYSRTPWLAPGGDPAENAAFSESFANMGRNAELRAANAADLETGGSDPFARAFARTKARIGANDARANAFSTYKLAQQARRQSALNSLISQAYGTEQGQIAQPHPGADNSALVGAGGDILGTLLPFLLKSGL